MIIVVDRHIPFFTEAVRKQWPDVQIRPMESDEIDALAVRDADVLVVRTRTKVNELLLHGTRVQLVCTATIGYDHIDTAYCAQHGIRWVSCPGCNAQAVCDYIEEALEETNATGTIGIVGVGHVGSRVAEMAQRRGLRVLLNDPPKGIGCSLDFIAQNCDIITFHTPLTHHGDYPTYHLCNADFLSLCKPGAIIINAARGGVVDEQALLQSGHPFILDTWENEPDINQDVLNSALRASMHIAGYSEAGKRNATQMCLDAISSAFNLSQIDLNCLFENSNPKGDVSPGWLERVTNLLKASPECFESLRKNYILR